MLGMGARSPLPFAVDHYRPWPDDLPAIRPLVTLAAAEAARAAIAGPLTDDAQVSSGLNKMIDVYLGG